MYSGQNVRVTALGDGVVELCFDRVGDAINKLDAATLAELDAARQAIAAAPGVKGILVTSAKDAFIVGADIFEFTEMFRQPSAEITARIGAGSAIFTRLGDQPVPSVAALNGFALGGGLEMALALDFRVMASSAKIGLPEITLGIFPGYGGTVRLPRLIGPAALTWLTSGRQIDAAAALQAGAVDRVAEPAALRAEALAVLGQAIADEAGWRARRERQRGPVAADPAALKSAVETAEGALRKSAPRVPAGFEILRLVEATAGESRDAALHEESRRFGVTARSQAAKAMIQIFINDQAVKKKGKGFARSARPVARAAVIGAGIMGGGIAYTSAVRGTPVVLKDIAQSALDLGMAEARKLLAKQVENGRLTQDKADGIIASIHPQLGFEGFDQADLVIEAIVENMKVKKAVLSEIEGLLRPDALMVSNTSSLSITEMAGALARPANFGGMHFFNPVPAMPLVEVIQGPETSDVAAATIASYALAMGKTPIVVKDCPGFLVNRILAAYLLGFSDLVRDGGDFRAIDRAMEAFGWPMGPAFLSDVIGMDTLAHVVEVIAVGYPGRMTDDPDNPIAVMRRHGRLGQKNGLGFYRYEPDPKGRPRKLPDDDAATALAAVQRVPVRAFEDAEIVERLMLPMIIEAGLCLEAGIAETAGEIDTALLLGLGFPRHVGGPLVYADWLGLAAVVERCDSYKALGPLYRPSEAMRQRAAAGSGFYVG